MNSKFFKRRTNEKVGINDAAISGKMLYRKLDSWFEIEPLVLMWELTYDEAAVRSFVNSKTGKLEEYINGNWRIEFQFVRAAAALPKGHFDCASIIAGYIKNTNDIKDGKPQSAYLLSLTSETFMGEATYFSAIELWNVLTRLGQKSDKQHNP